MYTTPSLRPASAATSSSVSGDVRLASAQYSQLPSAPEPDVANSWVSGSSRQSGGSQERESTSKAQSRALASWMVAPQLQFDTYRVRSGGVLVFAGRSENSLSREMECNIMAIWRTLQSTKAKGKYCVKNERSVLFGVLPSTTVGAVLRDSYFGCECRLLEKMERNMVSKWIIFPVCSERRSLVQTR